MPPTRTTRKWSRGDAATERVQLIYAWVRQILEGEYQSASWNHVHQAMFGQIDFPPEDQRRPTSEERIQAQIAWVGGQLSEEEKTQ